MICGHTSYRPMINAVQKELSFDERVTCIKRLLQQRLAEDDLLYMRDIYEYFPETKNTDIPAQSKLPKALIQNRLEIFLASLMLRKVNFH
eukprot:COSAG01_NODE_93_length_27013_cov_41.515791_10_plen_90_part_00